MCQVFADLVTYSYVYFKYMVSGDCTLAVCTVRICQVHTARGIATPISMLTYGLWEAIAYMLTITHS